MHGRALGFLIIPAVVLAAAALAYYSFHYLNNAAELERGAILGATRELALEKVLGIEGSLRDSDHQIFESVDLDNLAEFSRKLAAERPAVESVLILDENWKVIPDGRYSSRPTQQQVDRFQELFDGQIAPDLRALRPGLNQRAHMHRTYDGRPYLFSFSRRLERGRTFYVVIEADLTYLVGTVFPEYFAVSSPRLYQIVDRSGAIMYGYAFTGVPESQVVELGFPETLSEWRLRVAQREMAPSADDTRVFDLLLIGAAVAVIFGGIGALLFAARRERRANELKSEFISNVSHELKTPLSIISMFGEMLHSGRTKSVEQEREYAAIISRESRRLARLIDNVLDFARIERGADVYEFALGDVAEVVERSLDIYRHRLETDGIELQLDIARDLPRVPLDENAMTLAVLNLVDNAIKYAAAGGKLEVTVRGGKGVSVTVRDFGPGIASDEQDRIFERFYRARAARLKRARGAGIGLALVQHIAEAHGGRVKLESSLGRGSAFTIWIPAQS